MLTLQSHKFCIVVSLSWYPWRRWSLNLVVLWEWSLLKGVSRGRWKGLPSMFLLLLWWIWMQLLMRWQQTLMVRIVLMRIPWRTSPRLGIMGLSGQKIGQLMSWLLPSGLYFCDKFSWSHKSNCKKTLKNITKQDSSLVFIKKERELSKHWDLPSTLALHHTQDPHFCHCGWFFSSFSDIYSPTPNAPLFPLSTFFSQLAQDNNKATTNVYDCLF